MKLRSVAPILGSSLFFAVTACSGGGGTTGTGGATATGTGGATSSGGATGTGGSSATGGVTGSGGTVSTGGATGSGGAVATGGATNTGGTTATGGTTGGRGGGGGTTATGGRGGNTATGGRGGAGTGGSAGSTGTANAMMNFFVSSTTSTTGNLGGLIGADTRCQTLAAAVGHGSKMWHAYLSAASPATNAIDRIGPGPYYNAQGMMVAADKATLHSRAGDAALFITEQGTRVNGQWTGSPTPNQHDILTGTLANGTIAANLTCGDWLATTGNSQVGHSDGLGPNQATTGTYTVWNASHTGMCGNTSPGGGAGRIYCFVGP